MSVHIAVFAKPPLPGKAKTRLIPAVGRAGAASLARAFLRDVWSVADRPWSTRVLATPDIRDRSFGLGEVNRWEQGSGDLGARIAHVLQRGLPAMALGADSPDLPVARLEDAREALQRVDAVFGPAQDGGFYLLGMRRCPPDALSDISWSTSATLVETEARLRGLGLSTARIGGWFDVDEPEDLAALRVRLASVGAQVAPETRRALLRLPG